MANHLLILLTLAGTLSLAGCAARRPNLIARTGSSPVRFDIRKVSLMSTPSVTPRERVLHSDLAAELQRRGIATVPQTEADFTLAVGIEVHSEIDSQTTTAPAYPQAQTIIIPPGPNGSRVYQEKIWMTTVTTEREIRTEGIRIRLYPTREISQGRFQTAWDGYIEAGLTLRPERQPGLLHTLFDYVGRDFVGHVKIAR